MDEKKKQASGPVKWILIGISVIFLFVMLVLPLVVVVTQALSKGWQCYVQAVTDEYTLKALKLTIGATAAAVVCNTIFGLCAAWAMTRFHFRGKKLLTTLIDVPVTVSPVIAGLIYILVFGKQSPLYSVLESAGIQIVFAVPGIILATIFVTFPFVSREIIPVLEFVIKNFHMKRKCICFSTEMSGQYGHSSKLSHGSGCTQHNTIEKCPLDMWKCHLGKNRPAFCSHQCCRLFLIEPYGFQNRYDLSGA